MSQIRIPNTTYEKKDLDRAMSKAKIHLMARPDSAFFTTIVFSLKTYFDDSIPTACTDGTKIIFNPAFFMSLDIDQQVFLLLHEAMHVAYLHMFRKGERNHSKWNAACDHVINLQLIERNFKMPSFGLADSRFKGMTSEQVYQLLPPTIEIPMPDLVMSDGEPDPKIQEQVQDILVRAAIQSKMAGDKPGTIPGEIEIFLNKLLDPKLPWQRILQKYLQNIAKNDYTWRRPNRRFLPKHYLPSLYNITLCDLAVAVDTSGSVSDDDFLRFVSEVASMLRMMKPNKMSFLQFDSVLRSVNEIRNVEDLKNVKFSGRGGTLIGPVLEWAREHKPQVLLVFSDGYFDFHGGDIFDGNLVWVIHNNESWKAPFGKVIHYDM